MDQEPLPHQHWVQNREAELKAPWGWLSLTGLFWLQPGTYTLGLGPEHDIPLPSLNAQGAHIGVDGEGQVCLSPGQDGEFLVDGRVLEPGSPPVVLLNDSQGLPTEVRHHSLQLTVIRRSNQLALRVRDQNSPARLLFTGVPRFAYNPQGVFPATYTPYPSPLEHRVATSAGLTEHETWQGAVHFEHRGTLHTLHAQALPSGDLFVAFRDQSNATLTYGGGRFLVLPAPRHGQTLFDGNRAYNPPCAFTPYATCSRPHPDNSLPFALLAGEKRP